MSFVVLCIFQSFRYVRITIIYYCEKHSSLVERFYGCRELKRASGGEQTEPKNQNRKLNETITPHFQTFP